MTASTTRDATTLGAFADKVRANAVDPRIVDKSAADLTQRPTPTVEFGRGWYHEAAIQESDRTRKR